MTVFGDHPDFVAKVCQLIASENAGPKLFNNGKRSIRIALGNVD
jgi:hypothetical protein